MEGLEGFQELVNPGSLVEIVLETGHRYVGRCTSISPARALLAAYDPRSGRSYRTTLNFKHERPGLVPVVEYFLLERAYPKEEVPETDAAFDRHTGPRFGVSIEEVEEERERRRREERYSRKEREEKLERSIFGGGLSSDEFS